MAAERTSGIDFSGLEETFEWFKAKKNLLVGVALVLLLVWAVWNFVENQAAESKRAPWQAVFADGSEPWSATADELATLLDDSRVKGTAAEPFVLYWQAVRRHDGGDDAKALELLGQFRSRFGSHPLATQKLPGEDLELRSAVDRMEGQIRQLETWRAAHPVATANPLPNGAVVSLVTDRGAIVLALHADTSPASAAAFLKVAPSLKDRYIARATENKWIEIGVTEAGTPFETSDFTEGFPPFEVNQLSHFKGSVAFRQPPYGKAPFNPDLRVMLAADVNEDGRSTVFAEVVAGLEVLEAIARDARKSDNPTMLVTPVKITDVQIATPPAPGEGNR